MKWEGCKNDMKAQVYNALYIQHYTILHISMYIFSLWDYREIPSWGFYILPQYKTEE